MINWEVHTFLCPSQFAAFRAATILGCFVPFSLSYFVSAYLSSDSLKPGKEWEMQIESHIKTCRAVIMFITSNIFIKEKSYVRKEYEYAVDKYEKES